MSAHEDRRALEMVFGEGYLNPSRRIVNLASKEGRRILDEKYHYNVSGNSSDLESEGFILDLKYPYINLKDSSRNSNISGLIAEIRAYAVATQGVFSFDSGKQIVKVTPSRVGKTKC